MKRILAEVLRHLLAEPIQTLVAILALAHAILFVSAALWVGTQAATARDKLAEGLVITATLDPALDESQVKPLLDEMAQRPEVALVAVRTPRQERERLGALLGDGLLDGIDELALPMGVTVDLRLAPESLDAASLTHLSDTVAGLRTIVGVTSLPWDPSHVQTLLALASLVRTLGLVLGALAIVVATASVYQIIRRRRALAADHRALATSFGATPTWLDAPHYAAALLVGAASVVLSLLVAGIIQHSLSAVAALVPGLADAAPLVSGPTLIGATLGGPALALLGAWLAITRPDPRPRA